MGDMIDKDEAALAIANVEIGYHDGIGGDWHPLSGPAIISAACAVIRALPPAPDAVGACPKCGGNREQWLRCSNFTCPGGDVFGRLPTTSSPDAVQALVKAEHTRLSMTPAQFANMERWRGYTEGLDAMRDAALAAIRAGGGQ